MPDASPPDSLRRYLSLARMAWAKRGHLAEALAALGTTPGEGPARGLMRVPSAARDIHVPLLPIGAPVHQPAYMAHGTCAASDFLDPRYRSACTALAQVPRFHRKQWEFAYILHHLDRLEMLAPGRRGVGFGVGLEPLPAAFAARGAAVLATDAPPEIGIAAGWAATDQLAIGHKDLPRAGICADAAFDRLVTFRHADMTAIPPEVSGFDFCWSACCLEHLGSLQAGLDFIEATVEQVLAPGGVAVHTTEFNLSSDTATLETGGTVIYRHRDITAFAARMRRRGHVVDEFIVAPDAHPLDGWVDIPPYSGDAHLKLALGAFTCTSAGLVIRRAA